MHVAVDREGKHLDPGQDQQRAPVQASNRGQENLVHHPPSAAVRAVRGASVSPTVPGDVNAEEGATVSGVLVRQWLLRWPVHQRYQGYRRFQMIVCE